MELVTSRTNTRVKAAAALQRRRVRREQGRHLVEGPNPVREALAAGVVEIVFATPDARDEHHLGPDVEIVLVADHVLERVADTPSPQGVVAVASTRAADLAQLPASGLVVVLHELADPGNVGTILRTADAAGAVAVVCTAGTADVFSPKAVRAAAGSTYHLPLVVGTGLRQLIEHGRSTGRRHLGLDAAASRSVLSLTADDHPLALVLGNEAHGLDQDTLALLDGTLAVPMRGAAESLNVAAAAAVALYAAATPDHDRR